MPKRKKQKRRTGKDIPDILIASPHKTYRETTRINSSCLFQVSP